VFFNFNFLKLLLLIKNWGEGGGKFNEPMGFVEKPAKNRWFRVGSVVG
jgi:hypothetical protein